MLKQHLMWLEQQLLKQKKKFCTNFPSSPRDNVIALPNVGWVEMIGKGRPQLAQQKQTTL